MSGQQQVLFILTMTLTLAASGCVRHLNEVKPPKRDYQVNWTAPEPQASEAGSLYSSSGRLSSPWSDLRARQPGDLVTVIIDEQSLAQREASTALKRDAAEEARLTALFGALAALRTAVPQVATAPAIDAKNSSSFDGQGSTSRSEALKAVIPCTVRKVFANGNMLIEGHRAVLVNQDEQHLLISGVVRPEDIDANNKVLSTRMVDAHIEFSGLGNVASRQRQGWLGQWLPWFWPF